MEPGVLIVLIIAIGVSYVLCIALTVGFINNGQLYFGNDVAETWRFGVWAALSPVLMPIFLVRLLLGVAVVWATKEHYN